MRSEQSLSTKFPHLKKARNTSISLISGSMLPDVLQDLILHSKGAVISTLDSFSIVKWSYFCPTILYSGHVHGH